MRLFQEKKVIFSENTKWRSGVGGLYLTSQRQMPNMGLQVQMASVPLLKMNLGARPGTKETGAWG